ncbi:MAG TPA: hypothetical protein DE312_09700 [Gallionella sp.]|nr:MAG: hypothetical protein A2Z87_12560 [Gallionellales bacterium GWA2_54_124]HCI53568.1 hypothetical protein [Gallionella sp.]
MKFDSLDKYQSIFLEPEWTLSKYYGWKLAVEGADFKVLIKNFGPIKRSLVLSQLTQDKLHSELLKLSIFGPFSMITIKDFANQTQDFCNEMLIDGLRVAKVVDSERLFNKYTFVVDLSLEVDKLWSNMNADNKRVCRKAIASGMVVESISLLNEELFTLFYERYSKMAIERSLEIPNETIIRKMFEDGRLCMYYVRNGETICTIALVYSADSKSIFLYGVSGDQKNDGSAQLVQWKIIEHLKQIGQSWYDLGGVPELSDLNGICRFKKSFGGDGVDLGPEYYRCPTFLMLAKNIYKKFRVAL